MNKKEVNILVIGGSGHWSELNHYPAILELEKNDIKANVAAICDPVNPYETDAGHYKVGRDNLYKILEQSNPLWIDPREYGEKSLCKYLNAFVKKANINVIIIATDPTSHYFYAQWAVDTGVNILCDKPLIVVPDSSWKPERAKLIERQFNLLLKKVQKNQEENVDYTFCTPLRRRALTPFVAIAQDLQDTYRATDQGLTYMNVIVNGGVHRYPKEFLKGGAHGYLDGVGSLSHSSYHYIDVIAWYLQSAPGTVKRVKVSLSYVRRVRDYLAQHAYQSLLSINGDDASDTMLDMAAIPESVLNAELDFTVHLELFDEQDSKIGLVSYTCNHTTFSPRTTKYNPNILDHANSKNGGRMSQIYFDIHQGALNNWLLVKNDVVFEGNEIEVIKRSHPNINLAENYSKVSYTDAYDSQTVTPKDLFVSFAKKSIGLPVNKEHDEQLQFLTSQELTHKIFSATYELIAQEYIDKNYDKTISIGII